ncbi:conserved hypothetical protein [Crocosphaera subtropica ATCC 51142]|uniref:Uncharacterized protein n=1 Tax=Crocosphaera subtropica (strain ATCC 51142 / BH68) TaxID=43989 RepID=B1X021_CROS5|nr:hypothetical protein [Crocosphaera subtropica]ACB52920.1 conserved hypothetical protein [Crocosphaera subtropica ATCC 51142]
MAKLISFPLFCIAIVVLTYGSFGWYVAQSASFWSHWLADQGETWGWILEDETIFLLLHILAGSVVLLITASLAAPVAIITILFGSSFKSDNKAIIAVLLWSFVVVMMLRWIAFFAHFLLLFSAAILAKLELQKLGYPQWKVMSVLMIICLGGFTLGLLGSYHFDIRNLIINY